MPNLFRVALSFEPLAAPAPDELTPGVWVYEVEATGGEAALDQAEELWREAKHVGVGEGMPPHAVVTAA